MNPDTIETAVTTYRFLNSVSLILGLINSALLIVMFFRRQPSLDTSLGELMTIRKCEIKHREESDKRIGIYNQFREGEKSFKELTLAIGRLEGKVESMQATIVDKL